MARPNMAELKQRLKERDSNNKKQYTSDYYPFWNMQFGEEAVIRFLDDANEENHLRFMMEKFTHTLHINGEEKTFPCLTNYGEECPVCERSKKYYAADRKMGNKESPKGRYYYRNKTTLVRALLIKDPLPEDGSGSRVGKVVTISSNKGFIDIVNAELGKMEDDDVPTSLTEGFNFTIRKTKKILPDKEVGDYITSGFARKSTALPQEIIDEITLVDLSTLLPKNPGLETVVSYLEQHDKGVDIDDSAEHGSDETETVTIVTVPKETTKVESVKTEVIPEVVASPAVSVPDDDEDLVNLILSRNKAKK